MKKTLFLLSLLYMCFISNAQLTNIDFETSSYIGWKYYTGSCCPIVTSSGGTSTPVATRHTLTSGTARDCGIPVVSPWGGNYSLRLGNSNVGSEAERARYIVHVPGGSTQYNLVYHYAVMISDGAHRWIDQPRFEVKGYDSASGIINPCDSFTIVGGGAGSYCRPWSLGTFKLGGMAGRTFVVDFATGDCGYGGHSGYAYVDMNGELLPSIINVPCYTGTSTDTLIGPFGYASYSWRDSAAFSTVLGTSKDLVITVMPGVKTYAVVVTPFTGFGCKDTLYTRVIDSSGGLGYISMPGNLICVGETFTYGAPTGGTWTSSVPSVATIGSVSGVVTGLSIGVTSLTYTFTGCLRVSSVTVTATPAMITGDSVLCAGSSGAVNNSVLGGEWRSSNPSVVSIGSSSGVVTGITSGIATVSYIMPGGCYKTKSFTVNVVPGGMATPASICSGTITMLSNTVPGGIWTSSFPGIASIGSSTGIVTGLVSGIATITYAIGSCYKTVPVTVKDAPAPITGVLNVCIGNAVILGNSVSGGIWSSSNPTVATVGSISGVVTGLSAGSATITYILSGGCYKTALVTVISSPTAGVITGPSTLCSGQVITLISATGTGMWSSSNPPVATVGSATGIVTGVGGGVAAITYTVTYTCGTAMVTKQVTVYPSPAAIAGPDHICGNNTVTLVNSVGGGAWSSGGPSIAIVDAAGIVSGISPGIAVISYTMPGGCYTSRPVTVYPLPDAGIIMNDNINSFCVGETMHIWDTTSGGVWSITNSNAVLSGSTLTAVSAGEDTVMYIISNLCGSDTAFFYFTVSGIPPLPNGNRPLCVGDTIRLTDSINGGMWLCVGPPIISIDTSPLYACVVKGLVAGVVTMTYSFDLGCSVTFQVTVNPAPYAGIITGQPALCVGASTILENIATGGIWSSTDIGVATIDQQGRVTSRDTGNAYIIYTVPPNIYGCSARDSFLFSVITPHYNMNSTVTDVKCNGMGDGSVEMQKLGANIICSYQWSTGATTPKIDGLPVGIYIVTVTVINTQCKVVDTFRINEPDTLSGNFIIVADLCRAHTGSIVAMISGGVGPYKYLWSNNATGAEAKNLASGSYTLATTDANNCSKSYTVVVGDSCVAIVIRNALSPNGDGANDTWIIEGIEAFPGNKVQVFDKWGDLVYEKDGYRNEWAGTGRSGSPLPDGTFYYLVKLNTPYMLKEKDVYTGHLMIKR